MNALAVIAGFDLVDSSDDASPSEGVSLAPSDLDAAFPFHFVVDSKLRILSAGSVLLRILPEIQEGAPLGDVFQLLRPTGKLDFDVLAQRKRGAVVVRSVARPLLLLRGQLLPAGSSDRLVFIGSPRLSLDDLTDLGLALSDFAAHDGVSDYILLLQSQRASLANARRLSEELAAVNAQLDRRVAERTEQFERAHEALKRTTADHERALKKLAFTNEKLEREMVTRERMEGELRLAHRLEAVGQLAAGIAHEVNTPIQYVADSIFFLKDAFQDIIPLLLELRSCTDDAMVDQVEEAWENADAGFIVEQVPKAFDRMTDGVERVASIVRAMKSFAHPGGETHQPEDLNAALDTTLTVSRNEYKYIADVVTEFGNVPLVPCRLGEINQVFLNLIVNAAHAMADAQSDVTRGTITVRTALEDDKIAVSISDTGNGIPEAIRERVFDPFFTTKAVGKGTGQGLAIARSIIVKHGGTLTFESEVGKGTSFIIRLPISQAAHGTIQSHSLR